MASAALVLRGGTVVTASDSVLADIAIRDGRIVSIGADLAAGDQEIDVRGLQILPGGVDVHTHLDAPVGDVTAIDDFESGTAAAACGGMHRSVESQSQRQGSRGLWISRDPV
jgi:dihydropyrimidinase